MQAFRAAIGQAPLDRKVFPLDVTEFAQTFKQRAPQKIGVEGIRAGARRQNANAPDFALLLGECAEGRRERARAERDDKFAAFVHGTP